MATGTPELTVENLDGMDNEQLNVEVKKAKEELFNLRFQQATGQLETHGRIKALRRDVARIFTVIRERELGIRTNPQSILEQKGEVVDNKTDKDDAKPAKRPRLFARKDTSDETVSADNADSEATSGEDVDDTKVSVKEDK